MAYRFASYLDPAMQVERKDDHMLKIEERKKPKAPIPCDGCANVDTLFGKEFCAKGNKLTRCAHYKFKGDAE